MRKKKKERPLKEYYYRKKTKESLTGEQIRRILKAARTMGVESGVNIYRLIMVLLYTGMHPSVLTDLKKSRLKRVGDHLQWLRPKKTEWVNMVVPIHHKLKPWIDEFIYSDIPQYRCWVWNVVHRIGLMAGIPSLSPMSFRHTFGVMLDGMGFSPAMIRQLMGCSERVALRYCTRTKKQIDNMMYEQGWFDGEPKKTHNATLENDDSPMGESIKKPEFNYHAHFDLDLLD